MDRTKLSYNQLVDQLKNTVPVLEKPDELTQSIVTKIGQLSQDKRKSKWMYLVSFISGTAACILFCISLYEMNDLPASQQESANFSALPEQRFIANNANYSLSEKISICSSIIKEKQENKAKTKRIYASLSSKFK